MKVLYDARADALILEFRAEAAIPESDEASPGVILDYDASGNVVSIEVLDASQRVTAADQMEFHVSR